MMTKSLADLINDTRLRCDMLTSPANGMNDTNITSFINNAIQRWYNLLLSVDNTYYVQPYLFNLPDVNLQTIYTANGLGTAPPNWMACPAGFLKDVGMDLNPSLPRPITVHNFNFSERNRGPGRISYKPVGRGGPIINQQLIEILPENLSAGAYRLWYVGPAPVLALPTPIPYHTPVILPITIEDGSDNVVASTGVWTFVNQTFDSSWVGGTLTMSGAVQSGNNATRTITAASGDTLTTATTGIVNETFSVGSVASTTKPPYDNVNASTKTWFFGDGTFTQKEVGSTFTMAGAVNATNNGTFVISAVTSATTVVTAYAVGLVNETFPPSFTAAFQGGGTYAVLDDVENVWNKYFSVSAALEILTAQKLPADPYQEEKQLIEAEIMKIGSNRTSEPETSPIVDNPWGSWDNGNGYGWGPGGDGFDDH